MEHFAIHSPLFITVLAPQCLSSTYSVPGTTLGTDMIPVLMEFVLHLVCVCR